MSKDKPIFGIDVSHWQHGLEMSKVKAEGYEFAVIKASEGPYRDGTSYTDPSYETHLETAKAAGLIVGAYHFLVETPPKAQVDHFLDVVGDVSGKIMMVDFEAYNPPYQYLTPYNETLKGFTAELSHRSRRPSYRHILGQGLLERRRTDRSRQPVRQCNDLRRLLPDAVPGERPQGVLRGHKRVRVASRGGTRSRCCGNSRGQGTWRDSTWMWTPSGAPESSCWHSQELKKAHWVR